MKKWQYKIYSILMVLLTLVPVISPTVLAHAEEVSEATVE